MHITPPISVIMHVTPPSLPSSLSQNPSYYDLPATDSDTVNAFMSGMVEQALRQLEEAG